MLIAFASWEDRCKEGINRELQHECGPVLLLFYDEYASRTDQARKDIIAECARRRVVVSSVAVSQDNPRESWKVMMEALPVQEEKPPVVTLNISTMPRSIIWSCLWALDTSGIRVKYTYDRPERYSSEWLSRDPGLPRLMYKMSGIAELGRKTALLILSGYDIERTEYLLRVYEPSKILIGVQSQEHADGQNELHVQKLRERLSVIEDIEFFEVDAYSDDCGQAAVNTAVERLGDDYNIVASSLGPKLTAISLYRLQQNNEHVALAYSPSKEYNPDYSQGLGERICGFLR